MFTFHEDYIEVDEEFESVYHIKEISTPETRKKDFNNSDKYIGARISEKYTGVIVSGFFLKSLKIKNLANYCYENFKIVDENNLFILNSDEIPYYFHTSKIRFLYIDIKEDDINNYLIETESVDRIICLDSSEKIFDKLDAFYKKNILTYPLKDRVLCVKMNVNSCFNTIITTYNNDTAKPTYVPKIKSNSKSANKR